MEKPEIPKLKRISQSNCKFILNLYKTYSKEEIHLSECYYIQKLEQLQMNNCSKEIIWKIKDRLDLLIYEEERRTYLKFLENLDDDNDNNLDQFDTEYLFNDDD